MRRQVPEDLLFSRRDELKIILPLIAEQFLAILVGMADSIMIAGVGETAVSAVSLVDQVNVLMINLFSAVATGGAVIAGQYLGQKNDRSASHVADQLALVQLVLSGVITVLLFTLRAPVLHLIFGAVEPQVMRYAETYMAITALSLPFLALYNSAAAVFRTMADARTPMLISILMNAVNIAGNALLIYGFHMEVEGAAIPTLVSRIVAAVVAMALLFDSRRQLHFSRPISLKPDFSAIKRILSIGIPSGVENTMFQFGKLLVVGMIATFGTASIAANAVGNAIGVFQILPGIAIGMASVPMISRCYGAGKPDQVRYFGRQLVSLTYLSNIGINLLFTALIPVILRIYHLEAETSSIATWVLLFSAVVSSVLWPAAFMLPNVLRATGDVKYTMVVSVASMWMWRVLGSLLLGKTMGLGLKGVWYGMALDWIFRGSLYYVRFFGKKWNEHIRHGAEQAKT